MEKKKPTATSRPLDGVIVLKGDLSHLPVPTFITTETCGALSRLKDQVQKAFEKNKKPPDQSRSGGGRGS